MALTLDTKIPHQKIQDALWLKAHIQDKLKLKENFSYKIVRRNIDARFIDVQYVLRIEVDLENDIQNNYKPLERIFPKFKSQNPVLIVGAGPCGYFAALHLLTKGIRPIIIDRGKDVQSRRRDLRAIQQMGIVNPESNYCFGEGGAGTYSDGKLYTRSNKRGDIMNVLDWLVVHGATDEILVDVHPHIGSNKLPAILARMRQTILQHGGEIHFNTKMIDFKIVNQQIKSVQTNKETFDVSHLILATGHSARDIYLLLQNKGILIETKAFAIGLRIEHPQSIIDQAQYHCFPRPSTLPPAAYGLSAQVNEIGVFSFCMCPGGLIIPAATAPGEIVVNGMSLSKRDSPFANSGVVTSVDQLDFKPFEKDGPLQGMFFQSAIEQQMFGAGDGTQKAPAQKLLDFIARKESGTLPNSSYIPGLINARLDELLPKTISLRLREGLGIFGKKMKTFLSDEAVLVGTESRTSAPVKIPRDPESCEHPQIKGLFPSGEGAGYAGGILSAAMDGIRVAEAIYLLRS
ncbi:MAG: FAD-dependent monooxygenase [Saprospiraceae bacterium]|nr:FAD-dependent monooxygenase [Saprospiraceae bacterium]MBK7812428.1 FAD-dependent monooxygenase [Saprospiraceae bacterium]MBK9632347.1 FAD-dependent monooxygenase [Saprospiraceae bacterium]